MPWGLALRGILFAGALFGALFPNVLRADDLAACSLKRVTAVDMIASATPMAAIPIAVNGTKLQVLIDTAGILSSLSQSVVKKLDLPTSLSEEAEIMANGQRIAQIAKVRSLQIGEMNGSDFQFLVDPVGLTGNLDGRISPDILRGYDVDFDFANNKVSFFSQDHCPGKVVYWTTAYAAIPMTLDHNGHIVIRVDLDGQTIDAVVDTGSGESMLSEAFASQAFHVSADSAGSTRIANAPADSLVQYRHSFKAITMNGIAIRNPSLDILPDRMEQQMRGELGKLADDPQFGLSGGEVPRLILGMDVLRKLHLYIAYKEQMLYVSGAAAH
jgi:predicted aspartyl protease